MAFHNIKLSAKTQDTSSNLDKDIFTSESLSEEFFKWYESVEGGNYVAKDLEIHKHKEKRTENQRKKQMVKTILVIAIKSKMFHRDSLLLLQNIGRNINGQCSVVEELKKTRTWATVKNYLHAFVKFLKFLQSSKLMDQQTMKAIKIKVQGSIETAGKQAGRERQQKKN